MKFEIEQTDALLMMERLNVEKSMWNHYKIGDMRGYRSKRKRYEAIGKELIYRLRELGCELDVQVDPKILELADELWRAHNELTLYMYFHSFEFRDFVERHDLNVSMQYGALTPTSGPTGDLNS